jgi:Skp family chaperone for outer membrane proteins
MKKYIGFMMVGGLMLSFALAQVTRAENGYNASATVDAKTSFKVSPSGNRPLQDLRDKRQEDMQTFRANLQTERQNFIAKLKTDRDTFLAEVQAKKAEWKNSTEERKTQFCQAAQDAFINRFNMAISNLETYQGRVGDIIVTLNAGGKDTADATVSLNLSKQKLSDAKARMADIKALVPAGGCANVTPEIFEKIKVGARDTKDLLKESREALHQAIAEVRSLKGEATINANVHTESNSNTQ